ncbi:MAG: c-type cytochrome [Verrucomicrobiales bacterium]
MRTRAILLFLLGAIHSATGDEVPRFSTGLVHSGDIEIELGLQGAKRLAIAGIGAASHAEWSEAKLLAEDGGETRLDELQPSRKGERVNYDIEGKGIVRFSARVRLPNGGDETGRIQIFHDAPAPESAEKILKLKGNPRNGRNVFGRGTCGSCHVLDGRGGRVGPDLSDLGKRLELKDIIDSIITPDAVLSEGYETNVITTKDGTPHLGYVVADSRDSIVIKDSAGQPHELKKEEVVSRRPQEFSMMPPFGELLSPQQIADLAAFLKAQQG